MNLLQEEKITLKHMEIPKSCVCSTYQSLAIFSIYFFEYVCPRKCQSASVYSLCTDQTIFNLLVLVPHLLLLLPNLSYEVCFCSVQFKDRCSNTTQISECFSFRIYICCQRHGMENYVFKN